MGGRHEVADPRRGGGGRGAGDALAVREAAEGAGAAPNMAQLLLEAFRWFEEALLARLADAGWPRIRRPHSALFAHLDAAGTRPSELARRIGVTRQSVHETVRELVEMGLVELVPDPTNRSAKLVVLTRRGRRHVEVAVRIFRDVEAELAARLGAGRVKALRSVLQLDWGAPPGRSGTRPTR